MMPYMVTREQIPLYYENRGKGEALVFIHGLGLSHINWFDQAVFFIPRYQVITYDVRGHGRSGSSLSGLHISDLTKDLIDLLDHLNVKKAHLCAYSTGTLIALDMAASYPERIGRIVLTGAFHQVNNVFLWSKFMASLLTGTLGMQQFLAKQVARANGRNRKQIMQFQLEALKAERQEILRTIRACMRYKMDQEQLGRIQSPVLLIYGGNEKYMMVYRHAFLQYLPNVEVCLIPHVNHACPTKALEKYNDIVGDFLMPVKTDSRREIKQ